MDGWYHGLDGHEFECTPGVGDGQGGLACCDSWGRKESDMTEATQQQQQQEYIFDLEYIHWLCQGYDFPSGHVWM